jgi:aspartate/glutamate racemase
MKTIGLLGGMSWESTAIYYRHLNEIVRERLGGLHSAKLLLWSFDFAEIAERQHRGDWQGAAALLSATRCTAWPTKCRQRFRFRSFISPMQRRS